MNQRSLAQKELGYEAAGKWKTYDGTSAYGPADSGQPVLPSSALEVRKLFTASGAGKNRAGKEEILKVNEQ